MRHILCLLLGVLLLFSTPVSAIEFPVASYYSDQLEVGDTFTYQVDKFELNESDPYIHYPETHHGIKKGSQISLKVLKDPSQIATGEFYNDSNLTNDYFSLSIDGSNPSDYQFSRYVDLWFTVRIDSISLDINWSQSFIIPDFVVYANGSTQDFPKFIEDLNNFGDTEPDELITYTSDTVRFETKYGMDEYYKNTGILKQVDVWHSPILLKMHLIEDKDTDKTESVSSLLNSLMLSSLVIMLTILIPIRQSRK